MTNNLKLRVLSISIGLIFFYFGILKFFPNASPAESLGIDTVSILCFEVLSHKACIVCLALLELCIGLSLITGKFLKWGVIIGMGHLVMTFTPLIFFPDQVFAGSALTPSLLGQYIYKNIALISALWVVYPATEPVTAPKVKQKVSRANPQPQLFNLTSN